MWAKKTKMGSNEKLEKEAEIAAAECVTTQPGTVTWNFTLNTVREGL